MKNEIEKTWNYEDAVKELKPLCKDWVTRTLSIAKLLYVAREELSNSGYRNDLQDVTSCNIARGYYAKEQIHLSEEYCSEEKSHTFEEFCNEIGLSKRTAYSWLALYDPDKQLLLSPEEAKEEKSKELEAFFEHVRKKTQSDPDYLPTGPFNLKWNRNITWWSEAVNRKYGQWLAIKQLGINPDVIVESRFEEVPLVQVGLWSEDYLDSLSARCISLTSGANATGWFYRTLGKYSFQIPKTVKEADVLRVPVIVKASLESMNIKNKKDRAEVVKLLLSMIADLVEDGEDEE